MPFIDTGKLNVIERRPGWKGRYLFAAGASIHEHSHPNEEVWNVIDGELEVTIAGETITAGPGFVAIVPPNKLHSVRAISEGRAIVVDYPLRAEMRRAPTERSRID
jgi:unsaturated pyranuronate lyase